MSYVSRICYLGTLIEGREKSPELKEYENSLVFIHFELAKQQNKKSKSEKIIEEMLGLVSPSN